MAWAPAAPPKTSRSVESKPFARGELQVLGRDEAAAQARYQLHPLWNLSLLWLWNLNDRSSLLAPSLSYSASNEVTLTGGLFKGFGNDSPGAPEPPASEYGGLGTTAVPVAEHLLLKVRAGFSGPRSRFQNALCGEILTPTRGRSEEPLANDRGGSSA